VAVTPVNSFDHGRQLLAFLEEHKQRLSPLLILTHDFPDPDALASAFALQHLAQSVFGVQSRIAYGGELGRTENRMMARLLRIPLHRMRKVWLKKYPCIALVDTQPAFENNAFPPAKHAAMIIDQHGSHSPPQADLVLVDPDCGATCVIIAQALLLQDAPIPPRVATALYLGRLHASLRTSSPDGQAGEVLRAAFGNPRQAGGHGPIGGGSCRVGVDAAPESWREREQALQARLLKRLRIAARTEPRHPFAR
jgi:hypothetical protein